MQQPVPNLPQNSWVFTEHGIEAPTIYLVPIPQQVNSSVDVRSNTAHPFPETLLYQQQYHPHGAAVAEGVNSTYTPKASMMYFVESCASGFCSPVIREVPRKPTVLATYGCGVETTQTNPVLENCCAPPMRSLPALGAPTMGENKYGPEIEKTSAQQLSRQVTANINQLNQAGCQGKTNSKRKKRNHKRNKKHLPTDDQNDLKRGYSSNKIISALKVETKRDTGKQNEAEYVKGGCSKNLMMCKATWSKSATQVQPEDFAPEAKTSVEATRAPFPPRKNFCVFCKSNGEPVEFYCNHVLKDEKNATVCPILRKYKCPQCQKTGGEAHTIGYCPEVANNEESRRVNNKRYSLIHNSVGGFRVLKY